MRLYVSGTPSGKCAEGISIPPYCECTPDYGCSDCSQTLAALKAGATCGAAVLPTPPPTPPPTPATAAPTAAP